MAAAAALFVERGYDATTMTEIAARAGASIGSLYLFFPTKPALAQAMLTELADILSARLDDLQVRTKGRRAAAIADALFGELAEFLSAHPVYGALIDLPGDDEWKETIRARRREQISALFEHAIPTAGRPAATAGAHRAAIDALRDGVRDEAATPRAAVLEELRAMLSHHLDRAAG